ncbi:MAG TPA: ATP-binding protein, partial [Brevundimonas diminuta]|nr:ATP-binding protein [Brevundimonas diminuta]
GDGVRITQIVSNLVSNAVKFTAEGRVSVRVDVRAEDNREHLIIEVEDTGMGFDAEAARRLFDPFVQADDAISRQFGGTGLGLSICKSLAELMGGEIAAESALGEGSLFRVVLPVERVAAVVAEPVATSVEAAHASDEGAQIRVLAVEDNPANQMVVRCLLEPLGFEIVTADNGLEGVRRFQQEHFDMVLMDMQMPVMDGLDAMRRIRADEARLGAERTPIVMLTANTTEVHHLKAVQAGADHLVSKPVTLDILLQGMEQGAAAAAEWSGEPVLSAA